MQEILSPDNKRIKHLVQLRDKAKERRESRSFLIEGERLVLDTPGEFLQEVYVTRDELDKLSGNSGTDGLETGKFMDGPVVLSDPDRITVVSDAVMRKISDTQTPQGILAVVRQPEWKAEELLGRPESENEQTDAGEKAGRDGFVRRGTEPLLLILENIQDPGNLGTMFRTAEAAGATGIVMSRGCVDVFQPKVVRSTMSAIFREPFLVTDDLPGMLEELRSRGVYSYAAYLDPKSQSYDAPDYTTGSAFLIGNEGNGLSDEAVRAADGTVYIPMAGKIESLNAAMSAGILMYEASRQRRLVKQ